MSNFNEFPKDPHRMVWARFSAPDINGDPVNGVWFRTSLAEVFEEREKLSGLTQSIEWRDTSPPEETM